MKPSSSDLRSPSEFVSLRNMNSSPAKFAEALACVETLPVEDQAALLEVMNKRLAAARRQEMLREIAEARADYRSGKVKRGSAADVMRAIREK